MKLISKPLLYTPEWLVSFEKDAAGEIILSQYPGEVIREYRMRYDMSQEDLGELMDLRRESISRIENGAVTPTLDFIRAFIRAAALIEAIRVERAQHKEINVYLLENIAKEFGFSREKLPFMLKIGLESYDKKLVKIQKSLKEKRYGK
ncbi:MAG: helix-turn-helix transcriptional regulator [Candidatus Methanoperedens sp.]|nr:helix-turn-helix transcriptional regulator [Candidatus Methanoperedens sp.]